MKTDGYTHVELENTMLGAFLQLFDGTYGDLDHYKSNYIKGRDARKLKAAFEDLLGRKYMTVSMYDERTNGVEMKDADAMYEYLNRVHGYLFSSTAKPSLSDYTV